jgi:hypothetical protein
MDASGIGRQADLVTFRGNGRAQIPGARERGHRETRATPKERLATFEPLTWSRRGSGSLGQGAVGFGTAGGP